MSGGGVARRLFTRGPRRADLSVVARIVGIAWAVAVLLVQGCVSMTHADVTAYAEPEGFTVTADALPPGARPISALAYEKLGFYVLGLVPIVPVDLHRGVARLVKEARELGADGLAHLRYEFRPASAFRFVVFPLPDWSASLSITAVAYAEGREAHARGAEAPAPATR